MKRLNEDTFVDVNEELQNMINYTLIIWDGEQSDLTQIVTQGFLSGYESANNWLSEYAFTDFISNWLDEREKNSASKSDMLLYDDISKVAKNIMMHTSSIKQLILQDWSYEKNTRALTSIIKPNLSNPKVFPKGWDKVKSSHKSAFEYFDHFNLKEDKKFQGYNSDTAGAPGFHERINLANTFYGDSEQGRSPLYNLVSASFAHGLTIREHNNTVELFNEVKRIKALFDNTQLNKPTFIDNLQSLSNNKFFKALMIDKYSLNETREYNSQEQLDSYILEKNANKNIFGMVKLSLLGSDDYYHKGFQIQKIYNLEHFQSQITQNVEQWFEGQSYKEMYFSDNNFSTVDKDAILSSLTFKQLNQKEFESLQSIFGGKDVICYGDHEDFMDYDYPNKKEIVAFNASKMKELMASLKSEETDPSEVLKKENREKNYKKEVFSLLGIKLNNKNKIK